MGRSGPGSILSRDKTRVPFFSTSGGLGDLRVGFFSRVERRLILRRPARPQNAGSLSRRPCPVPKIAAGRRSAGQVMIVTATTPAAADDSD